MNKINQLREDELNEAMLEECNKAFDTGYNAGRREVLNGLLLGIGIGFCIGILTAVIVTRLL